MFVRADRLLASDFMTWFSKHAVAYYWSDFEPHLLAYDLNERRLVDVDLENVELVVSEQRRCVGRFDETYQPCPNRVSVKDAFDQCPTCAEIWIPHQECIFEPQCEGERCEVAFCRKSHLIYAAFFGEVIKIGMTGGTRVRERAIEQGADAIAPLVLCSNRMKARELEKFASRRLGMTQRMKRSEVLEQLTKTVSKGIIKERYERLLSELKHIMTESRIEGQILTDALQMLNDYPLRRRIDAPPEIVDTVGVHRGKMLMIKGKFVVFEDEIDSRIRMLELSDIVSRFIEDRGRKP